MTVSVVQAVKIPDAWSGSFVSNVTTGNTVFLVPTDYNTVTATMSATSPLYNGSPVTGATQLEAVNSGGSSPVYTGIWMLPAVAGSGKTVSVTMNNGIGSSPTAGAVGLIAIEVAGLGASPSQDQGNTGAATAGTAVSSAASGAITTVPEFVLASLVIFGQTMATVGAPWTELQFTDDFSLCGYQVVTSGSASYTYSQTAAGSAPWCGAIVTVKGTATAAATAPPVQLVPPGIGSPMGFTRRAVPSAAPPEVASADTGTGADAGTVTASVSSADSGSGTDFGSRGASDSDSGSGADTGSVTSAAESSADTGAGTDAGTVAAHVSSSDTGTAAESAVGEPAVITADTGNGTDTGLITVPVTGSGITWQLNPVRESMSGLDVGLHLSQALGGVLQFANHGSERLYVLSSEPGVTLTLLTGGMVLDQGAQAFPAVTLAPSVLYCFGPFHSAVQVPGTNLVQVLLSTAYGVQAVVVQGPDAH